MTLRSIGVTTGRSSSSSRRRRGDAARAAPERPRCRHRHRYRDDGDDGALETFNLVRGSVLATLVLDASTDQLVETFEPRLQQPVTGAQGVWVNVDETRRTIIMRVIR